MESVVEALEQDTGTEGKLAALHKYNKTVTSADECDNTIQRCLTAVLDNIDDVNIQCELLLFCKTIVRDKRVVAMVTKELFTRILGIARLTNLHEWVQGTESIAASVQARRAVFNICHQNTNCQAICHEARVDLNLFKDLQLFSNTQDPDWRSINCKLAFMLTAVSEPMRRRVAESGGLGTLTRVAEEVIYRSPTPSRQVNIAHGECHKVQECAVELSDDDLALCCDVFMSMFSITLHWDKISGKMEESEEVMAFLHLVKNLHSGMCVREESASYQTMIAKFLPIMINTTAQFPEHFLPRVDNNFTGLQYLGRDMSIARRLLSHLEHEASKSSGNTMVLMSILSILNKLTVLRAGRKYLREEILPPLRRVTKRPEEETHLIKSKVVKLMTHVDNSVAVLASELIFTICKHNVSRMIKYTGYGNAAGLFNRRGLMGSRESTSVEHMSADEDSDTEEYKDSAPDIDLVTAGPALENTTLLNMTDEEKEVEANKLINLIDGMHRKGVIKPGGVGPDGKIREMDIAEQLATMPDIDSEDDDEDLKLDSNSFFPRKKVS